MGKQKRHKVINKARRQDEITWDDLMLLREQVLKSVIYAESAITGLITNIREIRETDSKFDELCKGIYLTLADAIKDARDVMEKHITFGDNNEILDYKKGKAANDNDVFDIMYITNAYTFMQDKIANVLNKATQEFITDYNIGNGKQQVDKLVKLKNDYETAKAKETDKVNMIREGIDG